MSVQRVLGCPLYSRVPTPRIPAEKAKDLTMCVPWGYEPTRRHRDLRAAFYSITTQICEDGDSEVRPCHQARGISEGQGSAEESRDSFLDELTPELNLKE